MAITPSSAREIASRGRNIYNTRLREKLERDHFGKFLVIDVDTGEYEIDEDDLKASLRAFEKNPEGSRYGLRIGFRASGTIGGKRIGRTA
jgi:hypothetical protein